MLSYCSSSILSTFSHSFFFFFFNDTATTEIYTLSLHDALPISSEIHASFDGFFAPPEGPGPVDGSGAGRPRDRKSTRLNSSHGYISYAVFCLKKKKNNKTFTLRLAEPCVIDR